MREMSGVLETNPVLEAILGDVSRQARQALGDRLRKIILFGSYARGDYDEESDVDVMVLADFREEERRALQKTINKISSDMSLQYDVTVCILLKDQGVFDTRAELPFYRNVITEGIEFNASLQEIG